MSVLHGRERFLYSVRPGLDRFNAVWFAVLGTALLVLGVMTGSWVALFSLLCFAVAALSWKRASWTKRHPEVRRRVVERSDSRLTKHPRRYAVLAAVAFGGVGAVQLYRYTLGPRGDGSAPPAWSWPVAVVAGIAVGLLLSAVHYTLALRR